MIGDCATNNTREVIALIGVDIELGRFPVIINIFTEGLLLLHLLESRVTDIFNILLNGEKVSIEKLFQCESLRVIRNFFSGNFNK